MKEMKRNSALDLVRIIATFCVISVHFFMYTEFYDVYIVGARMFLMCVMREAFMICVPMFLMLTGYLMRKKELSGRFYHGIVKTLAVYAIVSVLCAFSEDRALNGVFLADLIYGAGTRYSWYIRMYTGLFLLIPFLNMMYRGNYAPGEEKKARNYRRTLIVTLLYLTALPGILNIYVFSGTWWKSPSGSTDYVKLVSNFWTLLYPITYYFLGSYIAEYGMKMRRWVCGVLMIAVMVAKGAFAYYRADGLTFQQGPWQEWGSLLQVVQAVLAFRFFSTIRTDHFSGGVKKLLKTVSDLCLGTYLVSQIFEDLFYPVLRARVASVGHRLNYYPIMALSVFLCSMALSALINLAYGGMQKGIRFAAGKAKTRTASKI